MEATELNRTENKGCITPEEIDSKLNELSLKSAQDQQMIDTAVSNILGNIELLMTAFDPTSPEYANLAALKEDVEMTMREVARWQYH